MRFRRSAEPRATCAERHAGFAALRTHLRINVSAYLVGLGLNVAVRHDIDRISAMGTGLRARHRAPGLLLFGRFSVADAYYAPVLARFGTYRPQPAPALDEYLRTTLEPPAMKEGFAAAAAENDFVAAAAPYRFPPV